MKRSFFVPFALAGVCLQAFPAGAQTTDTRVVLKIDGKYQSVELVAATDTAVRYVENPKTKEHKDVRRSSIEAMYFIEPTEFSEAMDAYRGRDYKKARELFASSKDKYSKTAKLKGNYSTRSAFYEILAARKMEDYEGMAALAGKLDKEGLVNKEDLAEVEVFKYWQALHGKDWPGILGLAESDHGKRLSGGLRAQIAYCTAAALEASEKPLEALDFYNTAMVADYAASEVIARLSAEACMRILSSQDQVKEAMRKFGKSDFVEASEGANMLKEAVAIAKMWDQGLGGGAPMPEVGKKLLKYEKK